MKHETASRQASPALVWLAWVLGAALLATFLASYRPAQAHDYGQWDKADPKTVEWFRNLMQPDNPGIPCCGEADAYWADSFDASGDHYVVIVTDERDDGPLMRPHIAPGTRVEVPNSKIKWDRGNPTGHGVLFVRKDWGDQNQPGPVYCFVPGGGV